MKRIGIALLAMLAAYTASAQYKPDSKTSKIDFTIQNVGFDVKGTFTGLQGTINFDAQDVTKDNFDITLDATTVNTDNNLRDSHLKDDGYFDVKNYPVIHFVSAKITPGKSGAYNLSGKLTIKGKSKDITFPFTTVATNDGLLLKGSFKINRKDFGVGGTSTISNELEVFLTVQAKKG